MSQRCVSGFPTRIGGFRRPSDSHRKCVQEGRFDRGGTMKRVLVISITAVFVMILGLTTASAQCGGGCGSFGKFYGARAWSSAPSVKSYSSSSGSCCGGGGYTSVSRRSPSAGGSPQSALPSCCQTSSAPNSSVAPVSRPGPDASRPTPQANNTRRANPWANLTLRRAGAKPEPRSSGLPSCCLPGNKSGSAKNARQIESVPNDPAVLRALLEKVSPKKAQPTLISNRDKPRVVNAAYYPDAERLTEPVTRPAPKRISQQRSSGSSLPPCCLQGNARGPVR